MAKNKPAKVKPPAAKPAAVADAPKAKKGDSVVPNTFGPFTAVSLVEVEGGVHVIGLDGEVRTEVIVPRAVGKRLSITLVQS